MMYIGVLWGLGKANKNLDKIVFEILS
jgi:hypothetical protein